MLERYSREEQRDCHSVFDTPYPETTFKGILKICAQLWQLCDSVTSEHLCDETCHYTIDAIVGCCFRLHKQVHLLIHEEEINSSLLSEDRHYLYTIIERLRAMCADVTQEHMLDQWAIDRLMDARDVLAGNTVHPS